MAVLANGSNARLKTLVMLSRWAVRLVLGAWLVLIMIWAGIHLLIVPRIADYRPQIESWLSSSLGMPLRIVCCFRPDPWPDSVDRIERGAPV